MSDEFNDLDSEYLDPEQLVFDELIDHCSLSEKKSDSQQHSPYPEELEFTGSDDLISPLPVSSKNLTKDYTRHTAFFWMLGLVAFVMFVGAIAVLTSPAEKKWDAAKEFLQIALAPLFTLLGSAVTYFYNEKNS